jgi:Acetyltransferase (GNAT) domain
MNQIYRIVETTRSYFQSTKEKTLSVKIAQTASERRAAQKLRKEVFAAELPAGSLVSCDLDEDEFDDHCAHLIVVDQSIQQRPLFQTFHRPSIAVEQRRATACIERDACGNPRLGPSRIKRLSSGR